MIHCQAKSIKPCNNPPAPDSKYCKKHGGLRQTQHKLKQLAQRKHAETVKLYISQGANFQVFGCLVEDVAIQRLVIETLFNSCDTSDKLIQKSDQISKMIFRAAYTVIKMNKVYKMINDTLYTKEKVNEFAELITQIILAYTDPSDHPAIVELINNASPVLQPLTCEKLEALDGFFKTG